jgi:hypothetical protein
VTKAPDPADIRKNVERNALAIGQITMQWTTIQVAISYLFRRLSGLDKTRAETIFFGVRSDTNQREMTLALARTVLRGEPELLARLDKVFDRIGRYSGERNAAAHALWVVKMPEGRVMPYPTVSHHRRLKVDDHEKQFERLLSNLSKVFRELLLLDAELARIAAKPTARKVDASTSDTIEANLGSIREP